MSKPVVADNRPKKVALEKLAGAGDDFGVLLRIGRGGAGLDPGLERLLPGCSCTASLLQLEVADRELVVDLAAHRVSRAGREVHLTPTEFKLLSRLVRNAGQVVTHRQLLADVWGTAYVERAQVGQSE